MLYLLLSKDVEHKGVNDKSHWRQLNFFQLSLKTPFYKDSGYFGSIVPQAQNIGRRYDISSERAAGTQYLCSFEILCAYGTQSIL